MPDRLQWAVDRFVDAWAANDVERAAEAARVFAAEHKARQETR